jgi:hypothetical protein
MTALMATCFGMCIVAGLLHGVLGLERPRDWKYLSLAALMACIGAFLVMQHDLYLVTSPEEGVRRTRTLFYVGIPITALFMWFVGLYTQVRLPRPVAVFVAAALAAWTILNVVLPYGVMFAALPRIVPSASLGGDTMYILQPSTFSPYTAAWSVFLLVLTAINISRGVIMMRRGGRSRGAVLILASGMVIVFYLVDYIRDLVGGTWPYILEYSIVATGLLMSVQLAIDFRRKDDELASALIRVEHQAARLAPMLRASRALPDALIPVVQSLERGLQELQAGHNDTADLARSSRAIARIAMLGESLRRAGNAG